MNEVELDVVDLKALILSNNLFGPNDVAEIRQMISENYGHFAELRDAVQQMEEDPALSPSGNTKKGVCQFLLGRFAEALQTLQAADGSATALFYAARAMFELKRYDEAIAGYQQAQASGYHEDQCKIFIAESQRYAGRIDQAMLLLDDIFGPAEQTAEYMYQRAATVAGIGGRRDEAIALYQRAVQTDENHAGALFGLAWENDRMGNDEEALRLYERAGKAFPTGVGALVNLGLIYEDRNEFDKAQICYKRILDAHPDDTRTQMYMKDASANGNMLYDEELQRQNDRLAQTLNMPVANFELSVRSRNCLSKMGIDTIGDLTRTSESELLSSKNFGETSLIEIREMLVSKGLKLGQFAHESKKADPPIDTTHLSPDEQAMLERPISDLNLSVRARKCMARLQLNSIGELLRKTGDELLECKNFGVTSLTEVREKLTDLGLKLRGD
ncbi:DNA-directed RNA polymerase subunit alpha [Stieleria bergensis]|uniref:DNA-directed RNA polymerase subunit alpha n=1 Tax=Stieleria bergensis TaxID=2528025 RepID=A0A517SX05_9BACT|nr:MAG: RNA polymerase subunit alpha domain protein [Rhodopirellula sp. TMED11]QDT60675.1 DNA-directed RNA polymerase subunit alpha [Planctomycetes bacterium SV_7m_r]